MYKYIAIEGNIGAGKTTLANQLAQDFDAILIEEQFSDNPFLPLFYKNPSQYALSLELSFLHERYAQMKEYINKKTAKNQLIVSDYSFIKTKLFACANLNKNEFDLFTKFYDIIYNQIPEPDILIYLDAPIQKLQENIAKRGRSYEKEIKAEYLLKIQNSYNSFLKISGIKTIVIEANNLDFMEDVNFHKKLITFLKEGIILPFQYWQPV